MTEEKRQILADTLQNVVKQSNEWFSNQEHSHSFIIGYLQGTINQIVEELKN